MADQTWTKTTSGNVLDTLGNIVGTGDGAGTITVTSATVQVTNGNTLRIEQGVTVKMDSASGRFLVTRNASGHGTLEIVGVEAEPVRITSNQGSPAAGDYTGIELLNTNAASNPTVTADWLILEYASTGIFSVSGSQQCTVTATDCTFRRIENSHIQTAGLPAGTWTLTRCVFDKCPADQPGTSSNNLIICSGSGSGPTMLVDHCSISSRVTNASAEIEIFQAGPRGTMTIENCLIYGENTGPTRGLNKLILVAPLGAATSDWNWYHTPDETPADNWTDGAHDQAKDAEFLDTSCSGAQDLRPNYDTGVSTGDEFGGLLGALEPYGVPVPPIPPDEPGCSETYQGFTSPGCVPFVCDYDFFTGEYPEDWRRELYDRKECQPHQLIVCIQIPNVGIPLDFEFAPGVPIPVVGQDAESVTVDLGCWVQSMRPVRAERDVTFQQYQGSDIDLVFVDWFGRLDPKIASSLFANLAWQGLRVDIGSWIHGTGQVLRHGRYFLDDIKRRNEHTVLRLQDWYLKTLGDSLRANVGGLNLSFKTSANPNVSFDPSFLEVNDQIATIEDVRLIMQDDGEPVASTFRYVGSVTGDQGIGSLTADFTTANGAVTISQNGVGAGAWAASHFLQGQFVPGDEVRFTLSNVATGTPPSILYRYLTQWGTLFEGTDILESEFLAAEDVLPTLAEITLRHDKPVTILEACRVAAMHGFLVLSASAAGRVVLGGFKPTLALDLTEIQDVAICGSNDLVELETENLPVYNVIQASYAPLDEDGVFTGLVGGDPDRYLEYPTADLGADFNRSVIFYGREYPLPLSLPGFRPGQESAVIAVLQNFWIYFEGTPTPREKMILETKLHNLNRDLEDIVRIESSRPAREVWGQVVGFGKDPIGCRIELTAVDVSDIVQPDFSCGYAFCDSGHYCDDCWVCW